MSGCAGFTSLSLHFDVAPVRAQGSVTFQTNFYTSLELLSSARYTLGSVCCRKFIVVLVVLYARMEFTLYLIFDLY